MSLNIKDPEAHRLARELLVIGRQCARNVKGRRMDHSELLYDALGLPK